MTSEYANRLMITRNGRKGDNGLKKIVCDSVDAPLKKIILKSYKEYIHAKSHSIDQQFHRIQAFNEHLFPVMPFLTKDNYESFIMIDGTDLMDAFWDKTSSPTLLSELTKTKNLDCAAQTYSLLLTIPESGWHPYVRVQKVHNMGHEEKSHVVLAKRIGKRVGILDPTLGSCMVESQQRKFLLPSYDNFQQFHVPVKSIPYHESPQS